MIRKNTPPPTRTAKTEAAYLKRAEQLRLQAFKETWQSAQNAAPDPSQFQLSEVIAWYCGQDERWSKSTIRQYQAALRFAVERAVETYHLSISDMAGALAKLDGPPKAIKARSAWSKPRTSARKRQSVLLPELEAVIDFLENGMEIDRIAGLYLQCNVRIALRPVEWQSATLDGALLSVECAKFTNCRGIDSIRGLDLHAILVERPDFLDSVERLVLALHKALEDAGSWATVWSRLASRIARACRLLSISRMALYTPRHVGLATAKQTMSPVEVAALAGHASDRTAQWHYAHSRTGFSSSIAVAVPHPALLNLVRQPLRTERQSDGHLVRQSRSLRFEEELIDVGIPHGDSAWEAEEEADLDTPDCRPRFS